MACDDPINKTKHIAFNLKQDTPFDPVTQAQDENKAPTDLTGYTFESRFLDVEGGTILDEALVTITGDPVNGIYKQFLSEAEVLALISLPAVQAILLTDTPTIFWEFFATKDGIRHKWLTADVGYEEAGEPAP